MIGYSSFNSGKTEKEASAVKQGVKVGTDLVLIVNPKYTGSNTASIPITSPTSTTSYTSGSATVYGQSGTTNIYGNSTTTTYGSETKYIPYTVRRYDYGAAQQRHGCEKSCYFEPDITSFPA